MWAEAGPPSVRVGIWKTARHCLSVVNGPAAAAISSSLTMLTHGASLIFGFLANTLEYAVETIGT